jgi:hypothetical protein
MDPLSLYQQADVDSCSDCLADLTITRQLLDMIITFDVSGVVSQYMA